MYHDISESPLRTETGFQDRELWVADTEVKTVGRWKAGIHNSQSSLDTFIIVFVTSQVFCWCKKVYKVHHSIILKKAIKMLCNEIYAALKCLDAITKLSNCDSPWLPDFFSAP